LNSRAAKGAKLFLVFKANVSDPVGLLAMMQNKSLNPFGMGFVGAQPVRRPPNQKLLTSLRSLEFTKGQYFPDLMALRHMWKLSISSSEDLTTKAFSVRG